MYEVTVKIGASPSKYWGSLEFTDAAGRPHRKEIAGERDASKQSNTLEALIECLKEEAEQIFEKKYSRELFREEFGRYYAEEKNEEAKGQQENGFIWMEEETC